MKMQTRIAIGVEALLLGAVIGAVGSAQMGIGGGKQPLFRLDAAKAQGQAFAGTVFDGGSVFVDLASDEPLLLTVEELPFDGVAQRVRPPRTPHRIRLAGGTPGDAGAILVSLQEPARKSGPLANAAAYRGVFDDAGSIVVELPDESGEVSVQGVEVTPMGPVYSAIQRLVPPGHFIDHGPSIIDTGKISGAIQRATAKRELVRQRFFGAVRMAGVQGSADVTVLLARTLEEDKDSFMLYLGSALAQRIAVPEDEGGGAVFHFESAEDLARAVEITVVLDAFAGLDLDLEWAAADLDAKRAHRGGFPRCGFQPSGTDVTTADATRILHHQPTVVIDLPTLPPPLSMPGGHGSRYTGSIGSAGSTSVVAAPAAKSNGVAPFSGSITYGGAILAPGDEPADKDSGAASSAGSIGNAGSVMAPQDEESDRDGALSWEKLGTVSAPARAGDKQDLPQTKDSGAGRFTGSIGDAGSVTVKHLLDRDFDKARQAAATLRSVTRTVDLLRDQLSHSGGHTR